ncbi:MAG: hypothetical protein ABIP64_05110 [Burkholderiales bacterium]
MSLFSTPRIDIPKEDPAIAAARQRQQNQADNALTGSIQDNLQRRMRARLQTFGLVASSRPNASSSTLALAFPTRV